MLVALRFFLRGPKEPLIKSGFSLGCFEPTCSDTVASSIESAG